MWESVETESQNYQQFQTQLVGKLVWMQGKKTKQ